MSTHRVVRPFANGHHEDIVQPGDEITLTVDRARDLGDLVEPLTELKAAPAPANKMAPAVENKTAPLKTNELPALPKRRGRPPKAR